MSNFVKRAGLPSLAMNAGKTLLNVPFAKTLLGGSAALSAIPLAERYQSLSDNDALDLKIKQLNKGTRPPENPLLPTSSALQAPPKDLDVSDIRSAPSDPSLAGEAKPAIGDNPNDLVEARPYSGYVPAGMPHPGRYLDTPAPPEPEPGLPWDKIGYGAAGAGLGALAGAALPGDHKKLKALLGGGLGLGGGLMLANYLAKKSDENFVGPIEQPQWVNDSKEWADWGNARKLVNARQQAAISVTSGSGAGTGGDVRGMMRAGVNHLGGFFDRFKNHAALGAAAGAAGNVARYGGMGLGGAALGYGLGSLAGGETEEEKKKKRRLGALLGGGVGLAGAAVLPSLLKRSADEDKKEDKKEKAPNYFPAATAGVVTGAVLSRVAYPYIKDISAKGVFNKVKSQFQRKESSLLGAAAKGLIRSPYVKVPAITGATLGTGGLALNHTVGDKLDEISRNRTRQVTGTIADVTKQINNNLNDVKEQVKEFDNTVNNRAMDISGLVGTADTKLSEIQNFLEEKGKLKELGMDLGSGLGKGLQQGATSAYTNPATIMSVGGLGLLGAALGSTIPDKRKGLGAIVGGVGGAGAGLLLLQALKNPEIAARLHLLHGKV